MKHLQTWLADRLRNLPTSARLTVQMTVAALAAYLVAALTGMAETAWAVISAVFVVQGTMDSTLGSAMWRVAGGAIGAAVALICIFTIGTGGFLTLASLSAGIVVMGLILARYPSLSFGLVTVVILVVSPGLGPVENALERTGAIAIGGLVGVFVAAFVFRRRASSYARRETVTVLKQTSTLVQHSIEALFEKDSLDFREEHNSIARRLNGIRSQLGETKRAPVPRKRHDSLSWNMVAAVESVWRTLPLLAPAGQRLSGEIARHLRAPLRDAAGAIASDMAMMADALADRERPSWPTSANEAVDILARKAAAGLQSPRFEGDGLRASALLLGMDELRQVLNELAGALGAPEPSAQNDADGLPTPRAEAA